MSTTSTSSQDSAASGTSAASREGSGGGSSGSARAGALRVLIADKFETSGIDALKGIGCHVHSHPEAGEGDIAGLLTTHDPDVLIVRSTKVREAAINAAGRLSLIVRAGAGVDNIDLAAASRSGIFVANCPGRNALAVAELAWGLIIACDRRIPDQVRDLREGRWDKKGYAAARGLYGRTLGIVGLGQIGEAIAARGRGFGMRVIAWSRSLTPERAEMLGIGHCTSPLELARHADVVSINVAANSDTRHLINEAFLQAMKDRAILVNTSRGSVVDETALADAVRRKGLRAGLDVFDPQPAPSDTMFENAIIREAGVYGTHHCGASTDQAQQAIAAETVRIVDVYGQSGQILNCVNLHAPAADRLVLAVRHLNRPGVLAHVFHVLSDAGINVEEMENILYDGADAACARIRLDRKPSGGQLDEIRRNPNVLSANVRDLDE